MTLFKCKMCGWDLEIAEGTSCSYYYDPDTVGAFNNNRSVIENAFEFDVCKNVLMRILIFGHLW